MSEPLFIPNPDHPAGWFPLSLCVSLCLPRSISLSLSTHTHTHTHLPSLAHCAHLPFICLRGAPLPLSWARQRYSTLRKIWKEVAERYSWVCPGERSGPGEQQPRACSSRAKGVLHTLPRPDTPSQGTLKAALCRWMEHGWNISSHLVNSEILNCQTNVNNYCYTKGKGNLGKS